MAKITRYSGNLKPFASNSTGLKRTVFGDTTQADDIDSNITPDFLLGWESIGDEINNFPTIQDFNAMGYTHGQLLAYLHQMGLPEWSGVQEYHSGSVVNLGGALYVCQTNSHVSATAPNLDGTNWKAAAQANVDSIADLRLTAPGTGPVQALGYYAPGDGGGGPLRVTKTAPVGGLVDNGGSILAYNGAVDTAIAEGELYWGWEWSGDIDIKHFGALEGVSDSYGHIQRANNFAESIAAKLVGSGSFGIGSTVVISCDADLQLCTFTEISPFSPNVQISTGSAAVPEDIIARKTIYTPSIRSSGDAITWPDATIGLQVVNSVECKIYINKVEGYLVGLDVVSNGAACAYNDIYIRSLYGNKINQRLRCLQAAGYVNENNFHGGRFAHYLASGSNVIGVQHINIADAVNIINNNRWFGPSLEGDTPEDTLYCYGTQNIIYAARWEGINRITFNGTTAIENIIHYGYNSDRIPLRQLNGAVRNSIQSPRKSTFYGSESGGAPFKFQNVNSVSDMGVAVFAPGIDMLNLPTQYSAAIGPEGIVVKAAGTDVYPTTIVGGGSGNNRLEFSPGTTLPDSWIRRTSLATMQCLAHFNPETDSTYTLGSASRRWSEVFAATGTINTSDEREKTFLPIEDAEKSAALEIRQNIRKFKFNASIVEKGESKARIHYGVNAQEVGRIMSLHGLNPNDYAFYCYDEWDEVPSEYLEDGSIDIEGTPAGNRYGIRYEELLSFIMSTI